MSYFKKIEYEIVLKESFRVIRGCSGCGRKTHFKSTKKFRVNVNGNRLDVWLIYQCENCKHTFNLPIYERQRAASIPQTEYRRFLENDELLAENYGRNLQLFRKMKAQVDLEELDYDFIKRTETARDPSSTGDASEECMLIRIHNPHGLKIRLEKQIAKVLESQALSLSRSQIQKLIQEEIISAISQDIAGIQFLVNCSKLHIIFFDK